VVVRAGHSVQSHPETVREVRRILLLHLAEACPTGCTLRATAETPQTYPWISGRKITHVGNAARG